MSGKDHSIEIVDGAGVQVILLDENGVSVASDIELKAGSKIVRNTFTIIFELVAATVSEVVWIAEVKCKLVSVRERHRLASTSGTLMLEHVPSGTAPGSGTNQLTGTISLSGTINTNVSGTLIASPTTFNVGDALGTEIAGTMTSLAGGLVTCEFERIP